MIRDIFESLYWNFASVFGHPYTFAVLSLGFSCWWLNSYGKVVQGGKYSIFAVENVGRKWPNTPIGGPLNIFSQKPAFRQWAHLFQCTWCMEWGESKISWPTDKKKHQRMRSVVNRYLANSQGATPINPSLLRSSTFEGHKSEPMTWIIS